MTLWGGFFLPFTGARGFLIQFSLAGGYDGGQLKLDSATGGIFFQTLLAPLSKVLLLNFSEKCASACPSISSPVISRLKCIKNSNYFLPGPACSDTIEPVAGVSKHFKTVVITYSAEGSITGEEAEDQYPYFFRTIAENGQYK